MAKMTMSPCNSQLLSKVILLEFVVYVLSNPFTESESRCIAGFFLVWHLQGDLEWPRKRKMELHVEIFICLTSFGAFLGPYMGTFDDLNHVLVYIFYWLFWKYGKLPKMAQNGQTWKKVQAPPARLGNILDGWGTFWTKNCFWIFVGLTLIGKIFFSFNAFFVWG